MFKINRRIKLLIALTVKSQLKYVRILVIKVPMYSCDQSTDLNDILH